VRRLATVLSVTGAALLLVVTPALAGPAKARPAGHGQHAKAEPVHKPAKAPARPVKREIALTGVLSDTATATIALGTASDTATVTLTIKVKGGERGLHGKVVTLTADGKTVVRRGVRSATLADLRRGDHVAVKARRLADGTWYAYRVSAAPRPARH
jgi:hypothetical protein